jgi:hypothetical protein
VNRILIAAVMAISATAVISHTALAQSDLGGTAWRSTNKGCDIDIDFRSDGTATVYAFMGVDEDTASWTLDGTVLHLKYDTWYGGVEGTMSDSNRINATVTWQSKSTQVVHNDPCILIKTN